MPEANPSAPPKVNPLSPRAPTLKLKPVIRTGMGGGLKAGLKLPPKPGINTATLKLPPKPGAAAAAPAPAPAAPVPTPAPAPAVADAKSQTSSLEQLKSVTQTLKSITAPIPQQAILHKTGIIADPGLTEAQMAAAKARTSRISLSDAMGVAPVKKEPVPMKTIRIKRPVDLPGAPAPAAAAPAPAPAPEAPAAEAPSTSVTQRKTLKVSRPGGAVRPSGKFALKKPAATEAKPEGEASASAEAEIADLPEAALQSSAPRMAAPVPASKAVEKDVPKGVAILGIIVQCAACVAMGLLAYKLYVDTTISTF